MPRPYSHLSCGDLGALLAEHCTHPDAHVIASELDFRVLVIGGLAQDDPMPDLEPLRPLVPVLLMGVPSANVPSRPGPRVPFSASGADDVSAEDARS